VRKRGEVPEVPATGTSGTPREVSGVVHGIYFLEKNEQVPRSERTISKRDTWKYSIVVYYIFPQYIHNLTNKVYSIM
jgi:hypothetical protein